MFAAALRGEAAAFIADTEAPESGVNPEVERKFNHRALVHLNLNADGRLWGILEPMTTAPRVWSPRDRELCLATRERLTPIARGIVRKGLADRPAARLVG
jgi:GAF domain-containing protein